MSVLHRIVSFPFDGRTVYPSWLTNNQAFTAISLLIFLSLLTDVQCLTAWPQHPRDKQNKCKTSYSTLYQLPFKQNFPTSNVRSISTFTHANQPHAMLTMLKSTLTFLPIVEVTTNNTFSSHHRIPKPD